MLLVELEQKVQIIRELLHVFKFSYLKFDKIVKYNDVYPTMVFAEYTCSMHLCITGHNN